MDVGCMRCLKKGRAFRPRVWRYVAGLGVQGDAPSLPKEGCVANCIMYCFQVVMEECLTCQLSAFLIVIAGQGTVSNPEVVTYPGSCGQRLRGRKALAQRTPVELIP